MNDEGDQLREEFEKVETALISVNGTPGTRFQFVDEGGDTDSQFWMLTLSQGERHMEDSWHYDKGQGGGATVTGINVSAKAAGINHGYVSVCYEFPGWNQFVDALNAKQSTVFWSLPDCRMEVTHPRLPVPGPAPPGGRNRQW